MKKQGAFFFFSFPPFCFFFLIMINAKGRIVKMNADRWAIMQIAGCFVLLSILVVPALAQGDFWTMRQPDRVWAMTDLRHTGSLNMSQDYSHAYSDESVSEHFTHAFRVNAPAGETRVHDVLSVIPAARGSQLWTATSIGYDPLNTSGRLTGSESTGVGASYTGDSSLCMPQGFLCSATGSQFRLDRGNVHSSVRTNNAMSLAEYDFSSMAEGIVSTGCSVLSGSGSGDSQTSYNQLITAEGEFDVYYSADFNLR